MSKFRFGRGVIVLLSAVCIFFVLGASCLGAILPKYFPFNTKDALNEWTQKIFKGKVLYEVVLEPTESYVVGRSRAAASGFYYRMIFDPQKSPYMSWRWKVSEFPKKAQGPSSDRQGWIEQDDYAARVYVIFPSLIFTRIQCIEYVWAEDLPRGEVLTSPFFKNIKLVVVESGKDNFDKWVTVERDIARDYKKVFGASKVRAAGAIAFMTDSDNTRSSATGFYTDMRVGYDKPMFIGETQAQETAPVEPFWIRLKKLLLRD